ncbi:cyclin-dependent protein kinase complex component, putative [Talaromyces stipitatus ATCC 10500]|uniref:Cyclin-dependent protein kinase complex component, putative n=1 Tax=Talaromyces stipitatus (strain ATCC 10500 / CBS 375.48 / QM 6759 / NRRL 1006) TaxID=441959 RepID=B8MBC7_TALSN|nr:cyclin-dependent protein kinase complex component, putative [Talaromyces stipitatus ATCC 10500]XP_002482909.1 cyclin-dependent protein kinase complex component, putative [Talaromyces stipitatus ATCC 10500]EED18916.1 cyclin-dependent protein kinase complex component, putative [Talaromyces stipitatus ATCC 10500]EED18917.1 cyclin-dependent protein kinase complex component, putative [Talaromyces stipitatus ATCC 10500]
MLGRNSTINRVVNPSELSYRSSPVHPAIAQQHNYYHPSSATLDSRETASPTYSTITPSAPSSVASHTPPYSSSSPPSHDVPAYVQSLPHQPYNSNHRPYQQFSDAPSSTMTAASSREAGNPESTMVGANSRYYPPDYQAHPSGASSAGHSGPVHMSAISNIPSPSSPQLHPTHPSTRSLGSSEPASPSRIKVRSLSHIQSFASEEFLEQSEQSRRGTGGRPSELTRQYEISSMPVADIIEMVAGLLTKITATNDMQHEHIHRHIPPPDGTANLSAQASSVLAFHGKNVPSITILNYLARIHKYCPTTYEVFLSLLVYFDRMTEMVNSRPVHRRRIRLEPTSTRPHFTSAATHGPSSGYPSVVTPPSSSGITAQDLKSSETSVPSSLQLDDEEEEELTNFFVVDSFNIHRLVIAGVTCASKFFSDVFYTNSRYAKVGGLPLVELNHLELQFLLLNDFRLAVPVEELEAYGTMLVEFYAREVIAQQQQAVQGNIPNAINYPGREHQRHHHRRDGSEYGQAPTPPRT